LELFFAKPAKTSGGTPDFPLRMLSIIEGLSPLAPVPAELPRLAFESDAAPIPEFPNPSAKPGCKLPGCPEFALARRTCGGKDGPIGISGVASGSLAPGFFPTGAWTRRRSGFDSSPPHRSSCSESHSASCLFAFPFSCGCTDAASCCASICAILRARACSSSSCCFPRSDSGFSVGVR